MPKQHPILILVLLSLGGLCILAAPFIISGFLYNTKLLIESAHFGCLLTNGTEKLDCIEKSYADLTYAQGAKVALATLHDDFAQHETVKRTCHQFAHAIGRAATKNNSSLPELFAMGDPFCWSGYYHGAIEGLLRGTKITSMDEVRVSTFCDAVKPPAYPYFDYFNCVHGVGHALMYISNNNLPESILRCAYFADQSDDANCAAGAFMENILASENGHRTDYIIAGEPFFPCSKLGRGAIQEMCYDTQATQVVREHGITTAAFATCNMILDAHSRDFCFHGLGREISPQLHYDIEATYRACQLLADGTAQCVVGAAKNFVAYYHGTDEAKELCAKAPAPTAEECKIAVTQIGQLQTKTGE